MRVAGLAGLLCRDLCTVLVCTFGCWVAQLCEVGIQWRLAGCLTLLSHPYAGFAQCADAHGASFHTSTAPCEPGREFTIACLLHDTVRQLVPCPLLRAARVLSCHCDQACDELVSVEAMLVSAVGCTHPPGQELVDCWPAHFVLRSAWL